MPGVIGCTGNPANGASELAAIQASLNAGGTTIVNGTLFAPSWSILTINNGIGNQNGRTILQGGCFRNTTVDIVTSRGAVVRDIELYSQGIGIRQTGSIQSQIVGNYICTDGPGIVLDGIAGSWIARNQINATPAANTASQTGIKIGASAVGYEATDIESNLIEGYYAAIRAGGGAANLVNLRFSGNRTDRPLCYHYLFSPSGATNVRNVRLTDFWMNGGQYAVVLNVAETTGRIDRVEVNGAHELGCAASAVTVWGPTSKADYRVTNYVVGPFEPG